jgi:predicted Fe-Mo cluster-binding NifX family protein
MCLLADIKDGRIEHSVVVPNPGCRHEFWADLFVRNAVSLVIAGRMGDSARQVLEGRGVQVMTGINGSIADAVAKLASGTLAATGAAKSSGCSCGC